MKLTREEALRLHRAMWSDMQKALGDKAVGDGVDITRRSQFKFKWCEKHFGKNNHVYNECFLCEYTSERGEFGINCEICPIDWGDDKGFAYACPCESGATIWFESPISKILALPEREVEDGQAH